MPIKKVLPTTLENYTEKVGSAALACVEVADKLRLADMLLSKATRRDLVRSFSKLQVKDILNDQSNKLANGKKQYPTIAAIRKGLGEDKVCAMVEVLLTSVADAFNTSFSEEVLYDAALEIVTGYYFLTIEDLYVCFRELKRSKQNKNLSIQMVFKEVDEYSQNRMKIAADLSMDSHLNSMDSHIDDERANTRIIEKSLKTGYDKRSGVRMKVATNPLAFKEDPK